MIRSCTWTLGVLMGGEAACIPTHETVSPCLEDLVSPPN